MNPARDFLLKIRRASMAGVKLRLPAVETFPLPALFHSHRRRHSGRFCLSQI